MKLSRDLLGRRFPFISVDVFTFMCCTLSHDTMHSPFGRPSRYSAWLVKCASPSPTLAPSQRNRNPIYWTEMKSKTNFQVYFVCMANVLGFLVICIYRVCVHQYYITDCTHVWLELNDNRVIEDIHLNTSTTGLSSCECLQVCARVRATGQEGERLRLKICCH